MAAGIATLDDLLWATVHQIALMLKVRVVVLLPDTTTSQRYTQFDAPYLTKAFEAAGLSTGQFQPPID